VYEFFRNWLRNLLVNRYQDTIRIEIQLVYVNGSVSASIHHRHCVASDPAARHLDLSGACGYSAIGHDDLPDTLASAYFDNLVQCILAVARTDRSQRRIGGICCEPIGAH
jgi:hypothetical protein